MECERLTVTPRTLTIGKLMVLRIRVIGDNGRGMRNERVTVRGAGIAKAGRTNLIGRVLIAIRPTRRGIVQIRVLGEPTCAARLGVAGIRRPPITG